MFDSLDDIQSSNDDSSMDSSVIIGGTMGGAILLLLMIIVLMCIAIMCMMRRYYNRKGASSTDDRAFNNSTKLNTNVTFENNPSYDIIKANTMNYYDAIIPAGDSDVPITTNPTYVPSKPYSTMSGDECNYVQPNGTNHDQHLGDTSKMGINPLHGVATGEDRTMSLNTLDLKSHHPSCDDATKECDDFANAHDDCLSHHKRLAITTDDACSDSPSCF